MLKHLAIVALAVLSALAGAQGIVTLAHAKARAPAIAKGADGHYWAQASVNGRPIRFLVDTGSSAVTLTPADAASLGFDTARLDYARPVTTVSGHMEAARVMLDHVSVAGAEVEHVQALVLKDGPSTSLLGMSYLGRLSSFEATPTSLVLRR